QGQLLALINPDLARTELATKVAKFKAAEADRTASEKTRDEARARFDAMTRSRQAVPGSVSDDDYRGALLAWNRFIQEEVAKQAALVQAAREVVAALTQLRMHEVRAPITGIVRAVYKTRGDAVKTPDAVLQIQNTERLRVEGLVDVQDARLI